MSKKNPPVLDFLNRPIVMIALALFAVLSGFMKWIDWSYVAVCVGAAVVGLVLAARKKKESDAPPHV
jgi:hypothetical protein